MSLRDWVFQNLENMRENGYDPFENAPMDEAREMVECCGTPDGRDAADAVLLRQIAKLVREWRSC